MTAGTVFDGSRKPLRLWFHVMWLMMAQKTGLSAKNLYDTYGFGSYQTAWGWLQKLRSVMIRAGRELDHVHHVISLLKRWLGGTHQGAVTPSHLQAYLDEFSFRFNRRLSQHRGKLFFRLMQQAVITRPPPVKAMYVSKPQPMVAT